MKKSNLPFLGVVLVLCLAGCHGGGGGGATVGFPPRECDDKKFECKVNGVSIDFHDSPWIQVNSTTISIEGHGHGDYSNREEIAIVQIPKPTAIPITIPIGDLYAPTPTASGGYLPKDRTDSIEMFTSYKCGDVTGHITITRLDEDRFEGTFRFRACQLNNSGAVVNVTEGWFSTCGW